MIERVQTGTKSTVEVIQKSQESTQKAVEQARDVGIKLDAMTHSVGEISDMNALIATATEEQTAVAGASWLSALRRHSSRSDRLVPRAQCGVAEPCRRVRRR